MNERRAEVKTYLYYLVFPLLLLSVACSQSFILHTVYTADCCIGVPHYEFLTDLLGGQVNTLTGLCLERGK